MIAALVAPLVRAAPAAAAGCVSFPCASSLNPTWGNNTPDKAIDGNTSTWWQPVSATTTPTITVDLGASTALSEARTQWVPGYVAAGYQIQTSPDGTTWTTQLTITSNTSMDRTDPFPLVTARYLQLVVTPYSPGSNPYADFALAELGWDGHGVNFPLAYSPNPTWGNNTPDKAIDGNTSTWWQPVGATTTPTLTVNLGASTTVSAARTQWYPAFAAAGYQIQTSPDGATWTTQVTVSGNDPNANDHTYFFPPVTARYLQLVVTPYSPTCCYAPFALTELGWDGHGVNFTYPLAYSANPTWRTNTPDKAIDGNTSTWWQPVSATTTPTITVNLGSSTTLSAARTQWLPGYVATGYQIQTSPDGSTWTTQLTVTGNTSTDRTDPFPAVSARYLQLVVTPYSPGSNPYADFALSELGWDGHGANFPLAYSANPTWRTNTPDKAIDGNTSTWWQPVSATTTPTITVNLGVSTTLSAARTQWLPGYVAAAYQIQTSTDGTTWTTQLTVSGNISTDRTDPFPPVSARYLQLVVTPYSPGSNPYAGFALTELGWDGHGANFPLAYSANPTWRTDTPDKAIDLNTSTWWQPVSATTTPTITVNLGASTTLNAARTQWLAGYVAAGYQIQTSPDGTTWTTRLTVTGNTSTDRTDTFPAVSARYLQLVVTPYSPGPNPYADFALTELGWNGHGV